MKSSFWRDGEFGVDCMTRLNGVPTETTAEFVARIEQLRHAYEAQFLDRKDWKVPLCSA